MCVGIFKNITTKKIHYNSSRVRDFFFVWASFILCSWYGIQNNGHANIIKKFKEPFELIIMGNKITAKYNLLIGVKDIVAKWDSWWNVVWLSQIFSLQFWYEIFKCHVKAKKLHCLFERGLPYEYVIANSNSPRSKTPS